jgi:hypothetical protein
MGRALLCIGTALALSGMIQVAAAQSSSAPSVPFSERHRAVQHGGIARAANSVITCVNAVRSDAAPCPAARHGAVARNGDYEMFYSDIDHDPNTYNSTRAELPIPAGARVTYARLYWGGNLRVGEQKPHADNGRVLIAEPGGQYRVVRADSLMGHRVTDAADAFSASADVTGLVRDSGGGEYTVADINVAMGHSEAGAWGGWTLIAAYEHPDAPLRELVLLDGFVSPSGRELRLAVEEFRTGPGAAGRLGVVGYDGDRGDGGERPDSIAVRTDRGGAVRLSDGANPPGDAFNSTIGDLGAPVTSRSPAYHNTLGYDSDVLDLAPALTRGSDRLTVRFGGSGYHLGAVFLQADVRSDVQADVRSDVRG